MKQAEDVDEIREMFREAEDSPRGSRRSRPASKSNSRPLLQKDVEMRDLLGFDQEALLNVYRCMFDIDTGAVPGGCEGGAPVPQPVAIAVSDRAPAGWATRPHGQNISIASTA